MTTILAFSDIHGNRRALEKLAPIAKENDMVLFAGDGLNTIFGFERNCKAIHKVSGNCDGGSGEKVIEVDGHKIFLTHGHMYSVKRGMESLHFRAQELGCDIVVFGHTHTALVEKVDGILYVNPGSCGPYCFTKTFAYIVINGKDVHAYINDTLFE